MLRLSHVNQKSFGFLLAIAFALHYLCHEEVLEGAFSNSFRKIPQKQPMRAPIVACCYWGKKHGQSERIANDFI